jgi:hypothetical protein
MTTEVIEASLAGLTWFAMARALLGNPICIDVNWVTRMDKRLTINPFLLFFAVATAGVTLTFAAVQFFALPKSSGKGYGVGIILGTVAYFLFASNVRVGKRGNKSVKRNEEHRRD